MRKQIIIIAIIFGLMIIVPSVNATSFQIPQLKFNDSQPKVILHEGFNIQENKTGNPPIGSVIYHSQGVTRVFNGQGTQLLIANDSDSDKIATPRGNALATFVYQVPNGSLISIEGEITEVIKDNKLIFSIIHSENSTALNSEKVVDASIPGFDGWIEESNFSYINNLRLFSAYWDVPAPPLSYPPDSYSFLFNGIEHYGVQSLLQPVLEWNYPDSNVPQCINHWCARPWYITTPDHYPGYFHTPPMPTSQGHTLVGDIRWSINDQKWYIGIKDLNTYQYLIINDSFIDPYNLKVTCALEAGNITSNSNLPAKTTFYNMEFLDLNSNPVSFNWNKWYNTTAYNSIPGLFVDITSQSQVTLYTNAGAKIGVVRNSNTWLLDASGDGKWGPGDYQYVYGRAGDVYVTGDWNNDRKTEIGVVRNSNTWILDASGNGAYGAGDLTYAFGMAGDKYVTGDWTGTGTTKIGVVRNNNTWLLDASGNGLWGSGDLTYTFGTAGDRYVTGDWTGTGTTKIGVVRNNQTWILDASGNGAYGAGDIVYNYGRVGDVYVTGDWNSDGTTEIGVVRNNNTWLLDASSNGLWGSGDLTYTFGTSGDTYVTGKWS